MKGNIKLLLSISFCIFVAACEKEGQDGNNALVDFIVEPSGGHCAAGGYKINSGLDQNANNVLDDNEIQHTQFICNGEDGNQPITQIEEEPAGSNCESGGEKLITGIDANSNGTLEEVEIDQVAFICNDDIENQIRLLFDHSNDLITTDSENGFIGGAHLPGFNINHYGGIDSISFGGYIQTFDNSSSCTVELYSNTTENGIANSEITTTSEEFILVLTEANLLDELSNGEIDLTVRISSETDGVVSRLHSPFLVLHRN